MSDRVVSGSAPGGVGAAPSRRRRLLAAAGAAVVGLTAAFLLVVLLWFLNPSLPTNPQTLLRGLAGYGSLFGVLGFVAGLFLGRREPVRLLRGLVWVLAAVLGTGAFLFGWHASTLAFSLPPGINTRLLKAAVGLGVVAFFFFYTALLHGANRRRYGWRSRTGMALGLVVAGYTIVERRLAYVPPTEVPRALAPPRAGNGPHLLFVGIDAASVDWLLPLAERGQLPFLGRAVSDGAVGRLAIAAPGEALAAWTTLATGRYAYGHGIVGAERFRAPLLGTRAELTLLPRGLGFGLWGVARPSLVVDRRDQRRTSLWELLARLDKRVGLVGWPLSAPPASELDFAVSDLVFDDAAGGQHLLQAQGGIPQLSLPPELAARARLFATTTGGVRFDDPVLATAFAADRWRAELAAQLARERVPDVLAVALPGFGAVAEHYFGGFSAVQFDGSRNREATVAFRLLGSYATALDGLVADLTASLPKPLLVVVASPSGVARPRLAELRGTLRGRPLVQGSRHGPADGALVLFGEGVAAGGRLLGAAAVDVAPTTLYALGLPSARDLDGRVLTAAFSPSLLAARPLVYVSSFEQPVRGASEPRAEPGIGP